MENFSTTKDFVMVNSLSIWSSVDFISRGNLFMPYVLVSYKQTVACIFVRQM